MVMMVGEGGVEEGGISGGEMISATLSNSDLDID